MVAILHDVPIRASRNAVFRALSTSEGLDSWWTSRSRIEASEGAECDLWFDPDYHWRSTVSRCLPDSTLELRFSAADDDWLDTRVSFVLEEQEGVTWVRFRHEGWKEANEHHRISSYCWAMYLRLLRRYVELGTVVTYADRLDP